MEPLRSTDEQKMTSVCKVITHRSSCQSTAGQAALELHPSVVTFVVHVSLDCRAVLDSSYMIEILERCLLCLENWFRPSLIATTFKTETGMEGIKPNAVLTALVKDEARARGKINEGLADYINYACDGTASVELQLPWGYAEIGTIATEACGHTTSNLGHHSHCLYICRSGADAPSYIQMYAPLSMFLGDGGSWGTWVRENSDSSTGILHVRW